MQIQYKHANTIYYLINIFYSSEDFLGGLGTDNDEVDYKTALDKSVCENTKVSKSNSDQVLAKRNKEIKQRYWTRCHLDMDTSESDGMQLGFRYLTPQNFGGIRVTAINYKNAQQCPGQICI